MFYHMGCCHGDSESGDVNVIGDHWAVSDLSTVQSVLINNKNNKLYLGTIVLCLYYT